MEKHRYNLNPHIKHHKAVVLHYLYLRFRQKARPDTFFVDTFFVLGKRQDLTPFLFFTGESLDDHIYGIAGENTLQGRAGNDTLEGGLISFLNQQNNSSNLTWRI